jgi:molybdopterin adenylyltransferase
MLNGDASHQHKTLKILIITLSDRASRNIYEDKSGPDVEALLTDFLVSKNWKPEIRRILIPDEREHLEKSIIESLNNNDDVIITVGSTGVGPRDIAPDVVSSIIDKTIPGVMEYIRVTYGKENPNALLSRSVAGIKDKTLIYSIPGSRKAAAEYMREIVKTVEHLVYIVNGLAVH